MARRRRRLNETLASQVISTLFGIPHPVTKQAITIAKHHHATRGGHYATLGNPLTNYKKPKIVKFKPITGRRTSPISETSGNKILPKSMAYRRKSTYKRSTRPRRRRLTKRVPTLWPRRKLVKMRMVWNGTLTCTSGAFDLKTIKANSLNDPTGAINAQLPLGLDQWAAMYQKYTVVGSDIKVQAHLVSGTGAVQMGIALKEDSTSLADSNYYREYGRASVKLFTPDLDKMYLKSHYNGKRFEKVTKWEDNDEYQGTFSTTPGDPTNIRYYHLFAQDLNAANTADIEYTAELTFYVLLTDAIIPSRSAL